METSFARVIEEHLQLKRRNEAQARSDPGEDSASDVDSEPALTAPRMALSSARSRTKIRSGVAHASSTGATYRLPRQEIAKGAKMAVDRGRRGGVIGGISLGGILVIIGIIVAIVWSLWLGIVIALIGLIAFGGFVRGKWY